MELKPNYVSYNSENNVNLKPQQEVALFSCGASCTSCARFIFIHLGTMKRIARVVSGHHEFGRVSGGSDFPAGQMAALCGQCVWCVCCVWGCGAVRRGPAAAAAAAAARWREGLLTLWLSPESQSHLNF